jgi:hypothetical protein
LALLVKLNGTGQVTPPVDTDIVPVNGAVQVTGSGFGTWGVGLTVDLNNPKRATICGISPVKQIP